MLVYNISVYSWPNSILKLIETWSRNFIWSGDISKKKLVIVSWKKCCSPYAEGGLGLRYLISLNEASNLRLCWELIHSEASWAKILCDRVLRNGKTITHHISSSLWSSIKLEYMVIMENSSWQIGNGKSIQLWEDSWCGAPLKETLDISENVLKWLPSKFQSMEDLWSLCDRPCSPQSKVVIKSAIINIIYAIWMARNNARFNDSHIDWKNAIIWISSNTTLASNNSKLCSSSAMTNFIFLKNFNVSIHPTRAPIIKEVIWKPPFANWLKCNTGGSSTPFGISLLC